MSPKERRAFRLGFLSAVRKTRQELHAMAVNFDAKVASVQEDAHKELRSVVASLDAEVANLQEEFSAVVRDVHRYRVIEHAIDTERDPNMLLN